VLASNQDDNISYCCCRYFRACILKILDELTKAEFKFGPKRSFGSENENKQKKKKTKKKKKNAETSRGSGECTDTETQEPQAPRTVDEVLQEKKEIAKEYMIINNKNWGKMSAMMLAAETQDREIIADDLCWNVIGKVWRNGKIRTRASTAHVFWCCFLTIYLSLCLIN